MSENIDPVSRATRYSSKARTFRKLHKNRAKIPLSNQAQLYYLCLRMLKKEYFKEWCTLPPREWTIIADDDADSDLDDFTKSIVSPRFLPRKQSIYPYSETSDSISESSPAVIPSRLTQKRRYVRKQRTTIMKDDESDSSPPQNMLHDDIKPELYDNKNDIKTNATLFDEKQENVGSLVDSKPDVSPSHVSLFMEEPYEHSPSRSPSDARGHRSLHALSRSRSQSRSVSNERNSSRSPSSSSSSFSEAVVEDGEAFHIEEPTD